MGSSLPVLYSFRRCPYAMRARLAIAASGQACELREVVLKDKPTELLAVSAKGTVPVLQLGSGLVIEQSLEIMNWALARHDPLGWLKPDANSAQPLQALISSCDTTFKHHLDRYKYPGRFEQTNALLHRAAAAAWLEVLNQRLENAEWLGGQQARLADMAIAPFVRQFAQTDRLWFEAQDWCRLSDWLARITGSDLFERIMQKHPAWQAGTVGPVFPPEQKSPLN